MNNKNVSMTFNISKDKGQGHTTNAFKIYWPQGIDIDMYTHESN